MRQTVTVHGYSHRSRYHRYGTSYSAIHKAASLMVPGHSMISTGTIPVEHKSVHWLSMGAAGGNNLLGAFQPAVFWERPVTKERAAL